MCFISVFSRPWMKVGVSVTLPAVTAAAATLPSRRAEPRRRALQAPPFLPELHPPEMMPKPRASERRTPSLRNERAARPHGAPLRVRPTTQAWHNGLPTNGSRSSNQGSSIFPSFTTFVYQKRTAEGTRNSSILCFIKDFEVLFLLYHWVQRLLLNLSALYPQWTRCFIWLSDAWFHRDFYFFLVERKDCWTMIRLLLTRLGTGWGKRATPKIMQKL